MLPSDDTFTKYVVCSKCNYLYLHEDCVFRSGTQIHSKHCQYNEFPMCSYKKALWTVADENCDLQIFQVISVSF